MVGLIDEMAFSIIFIVFLLIKWKFKVGTKFLVLIGISLLALTAISVALQWNDIASDLSIIGFYCLLAGTLLLIIENALLVRKEGITNEERPSE